MMKKYNIVNNERNQIICKSKNGGRHYRQNRDSIDGDLIPVCTTKGRAEKEAEFLNVGYYGGWSVDEICKEITEKGEKYGN